jgi:hypothetical protein
VRSAGTNIFPAAEALAAEAAATAKMTASSAAAFPESAETMS